mmetsp:Transcript_52504/g.125997  ORF Transcript_52504/g.125997 Transcript_52504/m.125997 type:complete len:214 (-) Transcript_52504:754-1395(-)
MYTYTLPAPAPGRAQLSAHDAAAALPFSSLAHRLGAEVDVHHQHRRVVLKPPKLLVADALRHAQQQVRGALRRRRTAHQPARLRGADHVPQTIAGEQQPRVGTACDGKTAQLGLGDARACRVPIADRARHPRVDVSLMESGLEHQRAAARAEPMADVGAPPPPFPGAGSFRKATVAFGAAVGQLSPERRHRLLFLHDPPLAVKLALEPPHLGG